MRASPAFQITVRRFSVWRLALLTLLVMPCAALGAWLASGDSASPLAPRLLAALVGAGIVALAAPLLRRQAFSLRWDSQQWHLGPESSVGQERWAGSLAVAIDLGGWMLLKFEPNAGLAQRSTRWLPVQRRGLEAQWHALRCAVYCARPEPDRDAGVAAARPKNPKNERP